MVQEKIFGKYFFRLYILFCPDQKVQPSSPVVTVMFVVVQ